MHSIVYHILGAGNPLEPHNHKSRARLDTVLTMPENATAILYGRQQPNMKASEAEHGLHYLQTQNNHIANRITLNDRPKSTSETMKILCDYIEDSYQLNRQKPAHGFQAQEIIVTNGPYMPRTRYLLKKQWQRLHPHIPWQDAKAHVTFLSVGGTFVPYWKQHGPLAIPQWLANPVAYECGAWIKALRDPFDEKLNQNRTWSQRLSKLFQR